MERIWFLNFQLSNSHYCLISILWFIYIGNVQCSVTPAKISFQCGFEWNIIPFKVMGFKAGLFYLIFFVDISWFSVQNLSEQSVLLPWSLKTYNHQAQNFQNLSVLTCNFIFILRKNTYFMTKNTPISAQ